MNRQAMRITVASAMRARDVSRPRYDDDAGPEPPARTAPSGTSEPAEMPSGKSAKRDRRRLGKRAAARRQAEQGSG